MQVVGRKDTYNCILYLIDAPNVLRYYDGNEILTPNSLPNDSPPLQSRSVQKNENIPDNRQSVSYKNHQPEPSSDSSVFHKDLSVQIRYRQRHHNCILLTSPISSSFSPWYSIKVHSSSWVTITSTPSPIIYESSITIWNSYALHWPHKNIARMHD